MLEKPVAKGGGKIEEMKLSNIPELVQYIESVIYLDLPNRGGGFDSKFEESNDEDNIRTLVRSGESTSEPLDHSNCRAGDKK